MVNDKRLPSPEPFAVVVNDDPTQLALLAGLTRKADLKPIVFTNVEEAIDYLTEIAGQTPDKFPALIITDLYMPYIDGWHFCRLLHSPELSPLNKIPIIVVSATFTGAEPEQIAKDLGAEGFISSPVDGKYFVEQVKSVISGKKMIQPRRVLVVEDDNARAETVKNAFCDHGCPADTAFTRREALEKFHNTLYDVVVIDHHLPDGNGEELLGAFHAERPDAVFIMTTSDPSTKSSMNWIKRGAAACLRKPYEPAYLIEMCGRARRERSLLRVQDMLELRTRELRESEERYRLIFNNSPMGLLYFDKNGVIASCNDCFVRTIGSSREKLVGLNMLNLPDPNITAALQKALNGGQAYYEGLYQSTTADKITPLRAFFAPVISSDGSVRGGVGIIEDVSEQQNARQDKKRLEAELRQAQKMESVGRLAGGVAHDFNNMLGVILGRTGMALSQADPAARIFTHLKEIQKAAERSSDLTRQLLAFARKQEISPKLLDLNKSLEGMLKILQRLIGEDIELSWRPSPEPCPVKLDPSQLDQILANLSVNARDAITGIGKIIIETKNVVFEKDDCKFHPEYIPGKYVLLSVSDTGCGMSADVMERAFDPFFTTKEEGKGTGLGLATVYGIVKQNGGFINVYSEPGNGTTFKIYIPRHREIAEQLPDESQEQTVRGQGTILVAEDEPTILEMVKEMLEELGYHVLCASTPAEAIRIAEKHAHPIDLLITDLIMPGMNGRDLAGNILKICPGIKRLFMSGYTADIIADGGILDAGVHFLQKPFTINELSSKVSAVIKA